MSSIFAFIKSIFNKIRFFFSSRGIGPVIVDPDPGIDTPTSFDPGEVVCYYGCPNSKKAKALQTNKKAYR